MDELAETRPEASMTMVVQPRCATCWTDHGVITPHPLTLGLDTNECPVCGAEAARTRTIEVADVRLTPTDG